MSRNFELDDLPPTLRKQALAQMRRRGKHATATSNDAPKPKRGRPEAKFQKRIIDLAHLHGWRVAHFRPARDTNGKYRTPVDADGAGFPDLVLAHHRRARVLFVEVKTDNGTRSPAQLAWAASIEPSGTYRLWRPADWAEIERELS